MIRVGNGLSSLLLYGILIEMKKITGEILRSFKDCETSSDSTDISYDEDKPVGYFFTLPKPVPKKFVKIQKRPFYWGLKTKRQLKKMGCRTFLTSLI